MFLRRLCRNKKALFGSIMWISFVLAGIVAPLVTPYRYDQMRAGQLYELPSWQHPMGADEYGRDILTRILFGTRQSLLISIAIAAIALAIGVPLGLVSGYVKGRVDDVLMSLADVMFSLPTVLWALIAFTLLGTGLKTVVIALSLTYAPQYLRLLRASALSISARQYVEAAQSIGASHWRIIVRHILPNCMVPLIVQTALIMSFAILDEAALSFVGLGAQPPQPSWGLMLRTGMNNMYRAVHLVFFPGLIVVYIILALNMLADGLRDVLDPYAMQT
ncbi:MAG: ABC transporter permease [Anaerolineae bacterium]